MLNFSVGPVQSSPEVLAIGGQMVPYFRTPEFSATMLDNERMVLELLHAPAYTRAVFLTGSGTASMESVVMHVLGPEDHALVVDGGSFGHRFSQLCELHGVPQTRLVPAPGYPVTAADLEAVAHPEELTALVVNIHETSTGVYHDINLLSSFCRAHDLLLVVDAISSFLADPLDMADAGADVIIAGSQKAFACAPGISVVALSARAQERVAAHPSRSMYLDLASALSNADRGQTPFTPAVSVLLQLHERMSGILEIGLDAEIARVAALAADFRSRITDLPLEITSHRLSNAVTPLHPRDADARAVVDALKDEYGIWVVPSGGELAHTLFRVGHIGALTIEDNTVLIDALTQLRDRGVLA